MPKFEDLTGKKFGRLTVIRIMKEIKDINPTKTKKATHWLCECECGQKVVVQATHLKSKNSQSCGCLGIELIAKKAKDTINRILTQREKCQKKWGII